MDVFTLVALSAAAMLPPDAIVAAAERRAPQAIELFRDFLTLPNDAHSPDDLRRVLDWLHPQLAARGFRTSEIATGRIPLLFAERPGPDGAPTLLIYLQADGQPVDPAAWDQPSPWTPVLKSRGGDGRWTAIPWSRVHDGIDADWRVFARSAADSKGPVVQFLSALDVIESTGATITHHLKVVIDTEEELGSPNLAAAVERERDTLAADFMLIFDGPPHASGRPSLMFGARGIATATLTVFGPAHALHSGHYGNYAPNPAMRLAQLLATMVDADGRVAIPGWYDGIELDDAVRAQLDAVPDDDAAIRAHLGIASADALGSSLQHAVQWPSLNVRGLRSAWTGADARTIVPSTATAELDIRLVPESDPQALLAALRSHIVGQGYTLVTGEPTVAERARHTRIARVDTRVSYPAFRTPIDSPIGAWLTGVMTRYHGFPPVRIRIAGGSVPIAPFVSTLGIPAVLVPTVNPDNNQHAPNENLRVGEFVDGIGVIATVLVSPLPR